MEPKVVPPKPTPMLSCAKVLNKWVMQLGFLCMRQCLELVLQLLKCKNWTIVTH
jgi:hypothetical protein